MEPFWAWGAFVLFIIVMLAMDLGVFRARSRAVSLREAGIWSVVWVALALLFGVGVYLSRGGEAALQYYSGYLIEKALSVDNIFVFVLLFSHFRVPAELQHRVLFWGILFAMVMRGLMIALGTALIASFGWGLYLFGFFLIWTGLRMLLGGDRPLDPTALPVTRLFRRFVPVTDGFRGQRFWVREPVDGVVRWVATPLLVVLVLVEVTDVVFAVDSIPAVFAITRDPFIVFTSNIMAILGLRSLYFVLAGVIPKFRYLRVGLSLLLVVVGLKMLVAEFWKVPVALSLGTIATILAGSVFASLLHARREEASARAAVVVETERRE